MCFSFNLMYGWLFFWIDRSNVRNSYLHLWTPSIGVQFILIHCLIQICMLSDTPSVVGICKSFIALATFKCWPHSSHVLWIFSKGIPAKFTHLSGIIKRSQSHNDDLLHDWSAHHMMRLVCPGSGWFLEHSQTF